MRNERKEGVLRLIDECNSLLPEVNKHVWICSRYDRRSFFNRICIFLGTPVVFLVITCLMYRCVGDSRGELCRIIVSVICGAAIAFVFLFFVNAKESGVYVPLSDKKAIEFLRRELDKMRDICQRADQERARLAPWPEKFSKLGLIIKEDLDGDYQSCEYVYLKQQYCRFYAVVRFEDECKAKEYEISEDGRMKLCLPPKTEPPS